MPDDTQTPYGLTADFDLLRKAVYEAGACAMHYFGKQPKQWHKADGQPVSDADIAVNHLLIDRLRAARPDYGWLSEESEDSAARLNQSHVWIVDPLDGTAGFLRQESTFTISVALVAQGRPLLGCVYNPAREEFYDAIAGQCARKNEQKISIAEKPPPRDALVICGHPALFDHAAWRETWPELTIHTPNSLAYRLCLVAEGAADTMITTQQKKDWDIAAGELIVQEAGGIVRNSAGDRLFYNQAKPVHDGVSAAHPALWPILQQKIEKYCKAR